ncbi:inositol monophosphatase [Alphaproteobacteria bacterium]|nr:inositol monophosphatase [Alphaproteobacteria bacterium]
MKPSTDKSVESFRQIRQRRSMSSLSPLLNVMVDAAQKAGRPLVRDFGETERLTVSSKGQAGFVSSADIRVEDELVRILSRARPEFSFVTEERGAIKGKEANGRDTFYIDPIDGTTNFLHGIPDFGVLIAHVADGAVMAGVIYRPMTDETFYAEKGRGAYLVSPYGTERLRVSALGGLKNAVVGLPAPHGGENLPLYLRLAETLAADRTSIRALGNCSSHMAMVAAGRMEASAELSYQPWDVAPGIIMVREAGGRVMTPEGAEDDATLLSNSKLICCNSDIRDNLAKILKKI